MLNGQHGKQFFFYSYISIHLYELIFNPDDFKCTLYCRLTMMHCGFIVPLWMTEYVCSISIYLSFTFLFSAHARILCLWQKYVHLTKEVIMNKRLKTHKLVYQPDQTKYKGIGPKDKRTYGTLRRLSVCVCGEILVLYSLLYNQSLT